MLRPRRAGFSACSDMERFKMKRHNVIALVLVTALIVPTIAFTQAPTAPGGNLNPAVIEVNGEKIYAAEISMTMQNIAAQMGGRDKVQDEQELVQMATQRVVEQALLAQEARRTNVQPNELRLAEMMQTLERQAGGREALESNLAPFGMSYDQLAEFVLEMELSRALIKGQISPTIQVSDEEVNAFYDENPQLFEAEAQVHARHIIFNATLDGDAQTVAEARVKAEQARQRALAGEDFAELARELSEGPSAPNGGDIGFIAKGQTAPTFTAAAFALQPGGISPVVRTEFGFHVIKVEEKRPAGRLPLDEVFDHVRSLLIQKKTGQNVGKLVESLADKATVVNLVDEPAAANQQAPK
jgi:peptidyl-prolyl cis-trans isomerase C